MTTEPMRIDLDIDQLTLGEIEDLEEALDKPLSQIADGFKAKSFRVRDVRALVWILRRRTDPSFSLEDARSVKISAIDFADAPAKTKAARRPPR